MSKRTEEQRILLANVSRVAKESIAPTAAETDRKGEFNPDVAALFWDLGLLQIMLPEKYGGWVANPCSTLCLCVEEIAKACASSALMLIIQAVGSFPLIHSGNEAQKNKYFPMLSEQRKLIGYLVTEPGAGSDVAAISTKAEKRGRLYHLNGTKTFSTTSWGIPRPVSWRINTANCCSLAVRTSTDPPPGVASTALRTR
jgi:cyclohexane-1-carbonyl-CoA dehydrogenase